VLGHPKAGLPLTEEDFIKWLTDSPLHRRPLFILAYAAQLAYEPEKRGSAGKEIFAFLATYEQGHWNFRAKTAGMNPRALDAAQGAGVYLRGLVAPWTFSHDAADLI
jgi:hypothetical protein